MSVLRIVLLMTAISFVASCGSSRSGDGARASAPSSSHPYPATSNPHPYADSIVRHGKTYDAVPAALKAVMIDKTNPHVLHAYIDIHAAFKSNQGGCFAYYWTGGVRSSDSSSEVIAAALYVWQAADSEASACGFAIAGGLPDVRVHLDAPLGSREVIDEATGSSVPLVNAPPSLTR